MVKKIIKSAFWITNIMSLIYTICSCDLFPNWHHMPHYLNQADVLFESNNGDKLFENESSDYLCVYASGDPDYHKGFIFGKTNYQGGTANSKYLTARLIYTNGSVYHCFIEVFDKSYNDVKTITFSDRETAHGITCTERYCYIYLENLDSKKHSLLRYDYEFDSTSVLVDNLHGEKAYQDDDVHLFFIEYGYYIRICKYDAFKTRLYINEGHFRTDKIDLSRSANDKNIIVSYENKTFVSETNLPLKQGSYWFYDKAYLIDNQLVFALYKKSNKRQCSAAYGGICICSLEESYLFKYDLGLNELSLIKQFDSGTYLIDYDLDGYKYYKDGGLYINDTLFRECEDIYPEYVEHLTNEERMDYYFSYYNGEFYGI